MKSVDWVIFIIVTIATLFGAFIGSLITSANLTEGDFTRSFIIAATITIVNAIREEA